MTSIALHEVSYAYPGSGDTLKRLSFAIKRGERAILRGPLGCGKTTTLRLVVGALPGKHRGKIVISELELTSRTLPEIRRKVGFVPAIPEEMLFMPTLLEEIAFAPLNYGHTRKKAEALATSLMERFNLQGLADTPPYRLSDGQKRLAAVAAVLAQEPDWLLLDEPTSNLDEKSRSEVFAAIDGFSGGILCATHDDMLASGINGQEIDMVKHMSG